MGLKSFHFLWNKALSEFDSLTKKGITTAKDIRESIRGQGIQDRKIKRLVGLIAATAIIIFIFVIIVRFKPGLKSLSDLTIVEPIIKPVVKPIVKADKSKILELSKTGSLFINVHPWGDIYLNGEYIGEPPITKRSVPVGEHTIEVMREGYQTVIKKVLVKNNIRESISIQLEKVEE